MPTAHNNNKANNHIGDATNNTFQGTQPVVADKKKNTKLKQQTQNVDNTTPKNNQNTEANNQAVGDQVKSFKRQLELNNKIIQPSQIQPSQIVKGGVKIS